jgi:hypothetical protein
MQFRMAASVRHIVSGVFDDDTLIDAPEVLKRPFELLSTVHQAIPGFRNSAVVIYNQSYSEPKFRKVYHLLVDVNCLFYKISFRFSIWFIKI